MNNNNFSERHAKAMKYIRDQVMRLNRPDCRVLLPVLNNQLEDHKKHCRALKRKIENVREEGIAAATRLLLPKNSNAADFDRTFFDRLTKQ